MQIEDKFVRKSVLNDDFFFTWANCQSFQMYYYQEILTVDRSAAIINLWIVSKGLVDFCLHIHGKLLDQILHVLGQTWPPKVCDLATDMDFTMPIANILQFIRNSCSVAQH